MDDNISITIPIPSDHDGYVLLQCPICGTQFKLLPTDLEDEGVLHIYCPSCGLSSENYITEDVEELATRIISNSVIDDLYSEMKRLERKTHNDFLSFKEGVKPEHDYEFRITSGVEAVEELFFDCCKRSAKIKTLLRITGCYCPFCGVKSFEFE